MADIGELIARYTNQAQVSSYFIDRMGFVSVKSFGATGDGLTDDTDAILNALAYAIANNLKSLFFPHGTYLVDSDEISAGDFTGIFCWGDNSEFSGISHPINQVGTNISLVTTLLWLTDTPATYAGQGGKVVSVKATEDGVEFTTSYSAAEINTLLSAYYTATQLNAGQLDGRYYTETEIDAGFATKQDIADLILGQFPPGSLDGAVILDDSLTTAKMAAEQKRGGASGVASLNASSKVIEEPASKAQANGIASLDASSKVVQEPASKAQANGIASLDASGNVPLAQLGNVPASDSSTVLAVMAWGGLVYI